MTIDRVEFISMTVMGPSRRHWSDYKPKDWPKWTAAIEGPSVVFEGEGRRVEVPRARCIVYLAQPVAAPAVNTTTTAQVGRPPGQGKRP